MSLLANDASASCSAPKASSDTQRQVRLLRGGEKADPGPITLEAILEGLRVLQPMGSNGPHSADILT